MFGCDAYIKKLEPLKKLNECCEKLVFVGYAPIGYRLLNPMKGKIQITRDVKISNMFNEQGNNNEITKFKIVEEERKEKN